MNEISLTSLDEQKKRSYADWAYIEYISWEREVKRPDVTLVKNLCERAIEDHPENVDLWDSYLEFAVSSCHTPG